jgi:BON domain
VLNPKALAEGVLSIGSRVAGGAIDLGRRALGSSDADSTSEVDPGTTSKADPSTAREPDPNITDTALARKVESELFRSTKTPKGKVDVNAVGRVVYLRGEAKTPALIKELEAKAAAIPEVQRVENLLHLPKTPSPTRSDTPARQRKEKTTKGKPPKTHRRRMNAEKPTDGAEPTPKGRAKEGKGREPAPLGSKDPETSGQASKGKGSAGAGESSKSGDPAGSGEQLAGKGPDGSGEDVGG